MFLGWAPGDEREVFTLDELIREFTIERVNKAGAVFDLQRLDYFNGLWIRRFDLDDLVERALPFAAAGGVNVPDDGHDYFRAALTLEQERIKHLIEVPDLMSFFFDDGLDPDVTLMNLNRHDSSETAAALERVRDLMAGLPEFDVSSIEAGLRGLADELAWKHGDLFTPRAHRGHRPEGRAAAVPDHGRSGPRTLSGAIGSRPRGTRSPLLALTALANQPTAVGAACTPQVGHSDRNARSRRTRMYARNSVAAPPRKGRAGSMKLNTPPAPNAVTSSQLQSGHETANRGKKPPAKERARPHPPPRALRIHAQRCQCAEQRCVESPDRVVHRQERGQTCAQRGVDAVRDYAHDHHERRRHQHAHADRHGQVARPWGV